MCLENLIQLGFPKITVHKRLKFYAYKIQLKHTIKSAHCPLRIGFAVTMVNTIGYGEI